MKNKLEDLRNHLFAALEGLADPEKPMEIARAQAISNVAKTLIDSARVEVEFLKVKSEFSDSNRLNSSFLQSTSALPALSAVK